MSAFLLFTGFTGSLGLQALTWRAMLHAYIRSYNVLVL